MTSRSDALVATVLPLRAGVPRSLRLGLRLVSQFLVLVGLYYAGTALVRATGVALPGNLVGMLLLLGLLRLGVVRLEHVEDAASLVLQHLNLFFLPLAVGLMTWSGLLGASAAGLGVSLAGSAAVCLAVAGLIGQRLATREGAFDAR
jgi:holin-like protein